MGQCIKEHLSILNMTKMKTITSFIICYYYMTAEVAIQFEQFGA